MKFSNLNSRSVGLTIDLVYHGSYIQFKHKENEAVTR